MAKLKIYAYPDTVLTQKAQPVVQIEERHRKLAEDMLETMYAAPGIGLAANQVGVLERVIVIDTDYDFEEVMGVGEILKNKNPKAMINPTIVSQQGKTAIEEGCLSVPEYVAEVQRSQKIQVKYLDLQGQEQVLDADGLLAVCIQHEIDHLDGKLFIDRLSLLKKELAQKKLIRDRKARESDPRLMGRRGLDAMSAKKKR
jgi:peptide deformylase